MFVHKATYMHILVKAAMITETINFFTSEKPTFCDNVEMSEEAYEEIKKVFYHQQCR